MRADSGCFQKKEADSCNTGRSGIPKEKDPAINAREEMRDERKAARRKVRHDEYIAANAAAVLSVCRY